MRKKKKVRKLHYEVPKAPLYLSLLKESSLTLFFLLYRTAWHAASVVRRCSPTRMTRRDAAIMHEKFHCVSELQICIYRLPSLDKQAPKPTTVMYERCHGPASGYQNVTWGMLYLVLKIENRFRYNFICPCRTIVMFMVMWPIWECPKRLDWVMYMHFRLDAMR
jgi:hypothetical protein